MRNVWRFASRHRWKLLGATALGGAGYLVWKTLKELPIRELIALAQQQTQNEIETTIKGNEGGSIVLVCLGDIRNDLSQIVDVTEKQAAVKSSAQGQERLDAFRELSIASFTRTISAVYSVCVVQLFVNTQIFELIKHQKQGRGLRECAQRRFLSVIQGFGGCEEGCHLHGLVQKVETAVRSFFSEQAREKEQCNAARLAGIMTHFRDVIEGEISEVGRQLQADLIMALAQLLNERLPEEANIEGDVLLGMRGSMESDVQERMLVARTLEIVQSELFSEALAGLLDLAFANLHAEVVGNVLGTGEIGETETSTNANMQVTEIDGGPSRPLAKFVPGVSNIFPRIMGQGAGSSRTFHALCADVAQCQSLFEVVGVSN